ncbi:SGNH/GDSL hydrolase family protein [Aeromicrobium sp. CF4.19]|uniref:SGNH/GDSL hydrolase family protein n=1 Tax=Aeromicrobium sp. CF4.19 TaxID=3373082 RepID=UPI003EE59D2F
MASTPSTTHREHCAENDDPHCLHPDAAALALDNRRWDRLVIMGDSVTAGVMEPLSGYLDRSFADRLVDALAATRPGFASTNLAVPELRAPQIRDGQLDEAVALGPDLVVISAGGNDALGRSFDAERLRADLDSLITPLAAAGALVVTIGLFDLPRSGLLPAEIAGVMSERFDTLDSITAGLTESVGGVHVDTHHHPVTADPGIYASDGIHANARGHAVALAAIVETLASRFPARSAR